MVPLAKERFKSMATSQEDMSNAATSPTQNPTQVAVSVRPKLPPPPGGSRRHGYGNAPSTPSALVPTMEPTLLGGGVLPISAPGRRSAPSSSADSVVLAARLRDAGTLRSEEHEMIRQAVLSLQSQYQRVKLQIRNAQPDSRKAHGKVTDRARDEDGRPDEQAPSPDRASSRSVRLELPSTLEAQAADRAAEEKAAAADDEPLARAKAALRCEVHGLRIALRILSLVAVSTHGMGLSEAHAYALLAPEIPRTTRGSIWALACQHVALLLQVPYVGVWAVPHACVGEGLRAALLLHGPGHAEHEQLCGTDASSNRQILNQSINCHFKQNPEK